MCKTQSPLLSVSRHTSWSGCWLRKTTEWCTTTRRCNTGRTALREDCLDRRTFLYQLTMLAEEDDRVVYDYEKVQHWSDGIAGGLFGQKNLFVPVNISNTHWIFLRVDFDSKTIELYDSMG